MQASCVVHVAFCSAARSLRQALKRAGQAEEVVGTYDTFSLGPIAAGPITAAAMTARGKAINEILGIDDWEITVADNAPLLAASLAADAQPVVWFSRRDTRSYAGFLWWLSHRGDGPCDIVDLTETILPERKVRGQILPARLAVSPSVVPQADLKRLRKEARPLLPEERRHYQEMWQRLVGENTPLRVIQDGALVSAPITYFDPLLLSFVIHHWRKMLRICLGVLYGDSSDRDLYQIDDIFLHARLRALVESGVIEAVGDVTRMGYCEVRLPSKK